MTIAKKNMIASANRLVPLKSKLGFASVKMSSRHSLEVTNIICTIDLQAILILIQIWRENLHIHTYMYIPNAQL